MDQNTKLTIQLYNQRSKGRLKRKAEVIQGLLRKKSKRCRSNHSIMSMGLNGVLPFVYRFVDLVVQSFSVVFFADVEFIYCLLYVKSL